MKIWTTIKLIYLIAGLTTWVSFMQCSGYQGVNMHAKLDWGVKMVCLEIG